MDLIRHEKESPFYLAKWTEVWYYLSSRDLLLMLKIFGEHNGEVSSFLPTALIIVVGWNRARKYYDELPDNLQSFLCNILHVSIGWVNRFSALIVFQLIKFYRYSPVSLKKLSKPSHSKLSPLWKFFKKISWVCKSFHVLYHVCKSNLNQIFCIDRIPIEMISC